MYFGEAAKDNEYHQKVVAENRKRLADGYATQSDRRARSRIREWQQRGVSVTPEQIAFADAVDAALARSASV